MGSTSAPITARLTSAPPIVNCTVVVVMGSAVDACGHNITNRKTKRENDAVRFQIFVTKSPYEDRATDVQITSPGVATKGGFQCLSARAIVRAAIAPDRPSRPVPGWAPALHR